MSSSSAPRRGASKNTGGPVPGFRAHTQELECTKVVLPQVIQGLCKYIFQIRYLWSIRILVTGKMISFCNYWA